MNEITTTGGGLIGYLHQGGSVAPMPFEQEIYLYRTHVAGASYVDGIDALAGPLEEGDPLELLREPDNEFDRYAILVRTASGQKIGYVPRYDNLVFARLMDAGKYLFARVKDAKKSGEHWIIEFRIYMKD